MCSDPNVPSEAYARTAAYGSAIDGDVVESRARAYAVSKGIPFTPMRQRVLALLAASGKTMAACEIAEKLSDARKAHAVREYRALEFLQEAGCAHRLASRWLAEADRGGVTLHRRACRLPARSISDLGLPPEIYSSHRIGELDPDERHARRHRDVASPASEPRGEIARA